MKIDAISHKMEYSILAMEIDSIFQNMEVQYCYLLKLDFKTEIHHGRVGMFNKNSERLFRNLYVSIFHII